MNSLYDNARLIEKGVNIIRDKGQDGALEWFNSLTDQDKETIRVEFDYLVANMNSFLDELNEVIGMKVF